jgi:hypothetical protein
MAKKNNTPREWRLLAERDIAVANQEVFGAIVDEIENHVLYNISNLTG